MSKGAKLGPRSWVPSQPQRSRGHLLCLNSKLLPTGRTQNSNLTPVILKPLFLLPRRKVP